MPRKSKNKNKQTQKWLFWGLLVVLFVGVVGVTFLGVEAFVMGGKQEIADKVIEAGKNDDRDASEEESESEVTEEEEVLEEPPSKVTQYEGENPNQLGELTGSISYMGVDPSGESFMVMTNIDQYLSGGACELVVKRNGQVLATRSASIIPDVSTSSCDRFMVPVSEMGHGETEVIINLSSGGKNGTLVGETKI